MTQTTPLKKSDLGVRAASAVVMVAVAGTALWLGGRVWTAFVALVALICLAEFLRLIFKSTTNVVIRTFGTIGAVLYIWFSANALTWARYTFTHDNSEQLGITFVAVIVGFVICTDIGAYFAGRAIGGPKIAPSISPSKTWAGLAGGMIAAGIWGVVALYLPNFVTGDLESNMRPLSTYLGSAFASGTVLAIVAQVGDFSESWLKRKAAVKDSSNLIPGHGGVFDRIDGLLPVLFVVSACNDWLILGDLLVL